MNKPEEHQLSKFMDPLDEWVVVARELVRENTDATLWDLIKAMYEYKTEKEVPDMPAEDKIVNLHMAGHSKREIAEQIGFTIEAVDAVLGSMGFKAFKTPVGMNPFAMQEYLDTHTYSDLESEHDVNYYMAQRVLSELDTWRQYAEAARR